MSNQNLREIFLNKLNKNLVKDFTTMDSPVKDYNGIRLESKTRIFKTQVRMNGDLSKEQEELLDSCIEETHKEMCAISQNGYSIFSFYTIDFMTSVLPSNDPNDPIVDMIDPDTFKPIKGPGIKMLGLKIRYAIA